MELFIYIVIGCLLICVIIAAVRYKKSTKNATQWCEAEVLSKKKHEHRSVSHKDRISYTYEAVFKSGEEHFTFFLREDAYDNINVGEKGKLGYKDYIFVSFNKQQK